MSIDNTSKLLVIPPSQKDSIPDSGNVPLEGLKSLCKQLRMKKMTYEKTDGKTTHFSKLTLKRR